MANHHSEAPKPPSIQQQKNLSDNFSLLDEEEREQLLRLAALLAERSIERRNALALLRAHGLKK